MPWNAVDALESVPVHAMEDKQCEPFIKGKTKEHQKDIVCGDTSTPDFLVNPDFSNFKVHRFVML